jgi:phosphopantothenoylcysteine decarboxylase/phosphopantothenate--cysteine ligase
MHDAVHAELDTASAAARAHDLFIAVAAVADWRPATYRDSKIKKTDDRAVPELAFAQNPDILASVAQRARPPYCVGFAAESESLEAHGRDKLARKGIPMLVANIGHETFGLDDNELLILEQSGQTRLARAPKALLAHELVRHIAERLS